MTQWGEELATSIMTRVRTIRNERGWTAQELAEKCTTAGFPMARNVVANLESGRRSSLTVAEVLTFAAVLGVHPAVLLVDTLDLSGPSMVHPSRNGSNFEAVAMLLDAGQPEYDPISDFYRDRLESITELRKAEEFAVTYAADTRPGMQEVGTIPEEMFREKYMRGPEDFQRNRLENLAYWLEKALRHRRDLIESGVGRESTPPPVDDATRKVYEEARLSNMLEATLKISETTGETFHHKMSRLRHPSGSGLAYGVLDGDD